jgi:hypothetical protein
MPDVDGGVSQNQTTQTTQPEPQPDKPWLQFFPESLRNEKTLEKFSGQSQEEVLGKLAQSYIALEKMPRGVVPPKDDAPKEEWDRFYERLGRPKSFEEYKVELKVPEGIEWNKEAETLMLKKMYERGLTPRQAQGLLEDYLNLSAEAMTTIQQEKARSREEAEAALRKEWGPLADRNIALVQRGVHEFSADTGFKEWLDETGAGNDPRFFKFALRVFQPMLEDNLIRGEGLGMRREEAQAEIKKLMATKEYLSGDKPTIERIRALAQIAYAE